MGWEARNITSRPSTSVISSSGSSVATGRDSQVERKSGQRSPNFLSSFDLSLNPLVEATMPDLSFHVESSGVVPFAAVPMIAFQLHIRNAMADEKIHTIALRCQIQIEVTRRRYTREEQERLLDLFGQPDRWSLTLRSLLWTHANLIVPGFDGA